MVNIIHKKFNSIQVKNLKIVPVPNVGLKLTIQPYMSSKAKSVSGDSPFNADPDPSFHFKVDPDPSFHFNSDSDSEPDPAPHQSDACLRPLDYGPSRHP